MKTVVKMRKMETVLKMEQIKLALKNMAKADFEYNKCSDSEMHMCSKIVLKMMMMTTMLKTSKMKRLTKTS